MPFKHKLSVRLAIARTLLIAFVGASLSCGDNNVASPNIVLAPTDELVDLVISPSSATVAVNDSLDFQAYGVTAVGDSVEVTVMWTTVEDSTSSTEDSTEDKTFKGKGKAIGRFKANKPGEYDLIAEVDSSSLADTADVTVVEADVAEVIIDPASAVLDVGQSVRLTVLLKDSSGNTLSDRKVVWNSSHKTVASVDSTGLVTGSASGQASIVAESEGVADTATISVEGVVEDISAPSITTTVLAVGTVGEHYSESLAATGGDGTYRWSLVSGSLPAGLSLATDGTISGTPTEDATSSFRVEVASAEMADSVSFSIVIAPPAPSMTTTTLPDGTVGQHYSGSLAAAGGDGTYSWSLVSGSLPAGISLA
ncbi:MAG: hypothetical protein GF341_09975, partial [candidate division Zixibacteria bacterium]|nr:hypothetical protein [candidate division Zixibacteria bacterium]